MEIIISILDTVQDLTAIVCGVLLLRLTGDYRERSRVLTVITFVISTVISVLTGKTMYRFFYSLTGEGLSFDDFAVVAEFAASMLVLVIWVSAPLIILRVPRKGRAVLLLFALSSLTELPGGILAMCLQGIEMDDTMYDLICEILIIACYATIGTALYLYSRNSNLLVVKNVFEIAPPWLYVLLFVISFFSFCVSGLEVIFLRNIIIVVTMVGIVSALVWLMKHIGTLMLKQKDILRELDEQQSGYEKMLKSDEQLREFRHDYKNHMLVVTALLNAGKTEEAADYLDKIKVRSGVVGRLFFTGNFVVDAILNNKNSLAEEFAVHIGFKGGIPDTGIENADLCTVFSNLLDNAIESTKHFEGNRYINIEASVRNGCLALSVENPVARKITVKNNRIKTSKEDAKNHGIGLKNTQRTAEKYGGVLLLSCSDTVFSADVTMKLEH